MSRSTRSTLLASVAVLATVVAPAAASAADAVMEWNLIAQGQTIPLRPTAHGETRGMAMVAGAMYDAVNAIERGHEPYLLDLDEVGRATVGVPGRGRGDRGAPPARRDRPAPKGRPRRRVRHDPRRDPGRADRE